MDKDIYLLMNSINTKGYNYEKIEELMARTHVGHKLIFKLTNNEEVTTPDDVHSPISYDVFVERLYEIFQIIISKLDQYEKEFNHIIDNNRVKFKFTRRILFNPSSRRNIDEEKKRILNKFSNSLKFLTILFKLEIGDHNIEEIFGRDFYKKIELKLKTMYNFYEQNRYYSEPDEVSRISGDILGGKRRRTKRRRTKKNR